MREPLWILAAIATLGGCAQPGGEQAAVRQADVDFARAVEEHDREAFASFIAEDARFYGGNAPIDGRKAVVEAWSPFLDPSGPELSWEPKTVELSGELAYTTGSYELKTLGEDGTSVTGRGHYVTIWRRQADGTWKVALDIGTPPA